MFEKLVKYRSEGKIFLKSIGGLCNRLRAIASAYSLAKVLHKELYVIWVVNNALGCRYDDLFIPPKMFSIFSVTPKMLSTVLLPRGNPKSFLLNINNEQEIIEFDCIITNYEQMQICSDLKSQNNILIERAIFDLIV